LESEWRGTSESTILQKLEREAARRPEDKIVVKKDDGGSVIWFDEIRFDFESGRLSKIGASRAP
jgi:hypothetical protein